MGTRAVSQSKLRAQRHRVVVVCRHLLAAIRVGRPTIARAPAHNHSRSDADCRGYNQWTLETGETDIQVRLSRLGHIVRSFLCCSSSNLANSSLCVFTRKTHLSRVQKPNTWTQALNETWAWGVDCISGVNLGGWFVLEPLVSPLSFSFNSLDIQRGDDGTQLANYKMTDHCLIADRTRHHSNRKGRAQLVPLLIPFWARRCVISHRADVQSDEGHEIHSGWANGATSRASRSFWAFVGSASLLSLLYFTKCRPQIRRTALRIGAQVRVSCALISSIRFGSIHFALCVFCRLNHGKGGPSNFFNRITGTANAQRMLDYIRVIAEFILQPEYQNFIPMFAMVNEARLADIGSVLHNMIRGVTGYNAGGGPSTTASKMCPPFVFSVVLSGEQIDVHARSWAQFGVRARSATGGLYLDDVNGSETYGECCG
ncbi:hypothetical protein B0H12DRAFT_1224467 [Mycena haematopus]|nr:hypothetical protein B0H12DRAFT_1224467 [Mycena haematopus]